MSHVTITFLNSSEWIGLTFPREKYLVIVFITVHYFCVASCDSAKAPGSISLSYNYSKPKHSVLAGIM